MASVAGANRLQAPSTTVAGLQTVGVKSSFIAALEYDAANLTLTTHLKNGAIYQHKFVTPLEWDALKQAQNHGRHWAEHVKGKKLSVRVKVAKAPKADLKHPGRIKL